MRFANKIFIVTFLVASSLAFGVDYLSQNYVKRREEAAYISKYSLLAKSLGNSLNNLEANAEKQMYDAGKVVALEDEHFGLLSTKRLKSLLMEDFRQGALNEIHAQPNMNESSPIGVWQA